MQENPSILKKRSILVNPNDIAESYEYIQQGYKALFELNPNAVCSLDLEGNFTSANQAMLDKAECDWETIAQLK